MTHQSSIVHIDTCYGEGLNSESDVGSIGGWISGDVTW
jgi:hypothetical protein